MSNRPNKRQEGEFCEHKECANCGDISVGRAAALIMFAAAFGMFATWQ